MSRFSPVAGQLFLSVVLLVGFAMPLTAANRHHDNHGNRANHGNRGSSHNYNSGNRNTVNVNVDARGNGRGYYDRHYNDHYHRHYNDDHHPIGTAVAVTAAAVVTAAVVGSVVNANRLPPDCAQVVRGGTAYLQCGPANDAMKDDMKATKDAMKGGMRGVLGY